MIATTVREEWNDFEEKCLIGHSPESIDKFQHVFYAAYNAALLQVMLLIRSGATVDTVIALEIECSEHWSKHFPGESDDGACD